MNKIKNKKTLIINITLVIGLILSFLVTTYALIKLATTVDDNLFQTGKMKINLNDGKTIIEENEFIFEPGMTVTKEFFIENQGTFDVYYKIYLDDVNGKLADVLNITIKKDDKVLCQGTANELNKNNVEVTDEILKANEKHVLSAVFHYPEDSGNSTQNSNITFTLGVDAVQAKNNPDKEF